MPTISIAAFRRRLASRTDAEPLLQAYRALTHRPDAARRARMAGWAEWPAPPRSRR